MEFKKVTELIELLLIKKNNFSINKDEELLIEELFFLLVNNKDSKDVLWGRPVATSTGFASQTANIIDLKNKGIEIALNLVPVKTKNFKWTLNTMFTKNKK